MTVAIVTGAAGGIGAALAHRLSARGVHVVVCDVDAAATRAVAAEVDGTAAPFDVGDRNEWSAVVERTVDAHGSIDTLALNAGIMTRPKGVAMAGDDPLAWFDARYEAVRRVNLDGVVHGIAAVAAHMPDGGSICVTSSTAGIGPQPEDPLYSATKHAVIGLVRSLAPTLADRGVRIAAVCPGGVDTSLVPPDFAEYAHRFLSAADVAGAIDEALGRPLDDSGAVWVVLQPGGPATRHEFTPIG